MSRVDRIPGLLAAKTLENHRSISASPQLCRLGIAIAFLSSRTERGKKAMLANMFMLILFYVVLVVPMLWLLRPVRMVTPY